VDVDSKGILVEWGETCKIVKGLDYPVDPMWALGREEKRWDAEGKRA
jgi:hypothetical protein